MNYQRSKTYLVHYEISTIISKAEDNREEKLRYNFH